MEKEKIGKKAAVFLMGIGVLGLFGGCTVELSPRKQVMSEAQIRAEVERELLQKEYFKTLKMVVDEYEKLDEEGREKEVQGSNKELGKGKLNETKGVVPERKNVLEKSVEGKNEDVFLPGETYYGMLRESGCRYRMSFVLAENERRLKTKELNKRVKIYGCDDVYVELKRAFPEFFVRKGKGGVIEIGDFYEKEYRAGVFMNDLRKRIKDLLKTPKARAVFYADGTVKIWGTKIDHQAVKDYLDGLYRAKYYEYCYRVVVKKAGILGMAKKGEYTGYLYPGICGMLGEDGRIEVLKKIVDREGEKVFLKVFLSEEGVSRILVFPVSGGQEVFRDGNLVVEVQLEPQENWLRKF